MPGIMRKQQQPRRWKAAIAASTSLTNSSVETVVGTATIPANTLRAGSRILLKYQGIVTATTGATTLTIKAYLGAVTLTGTALISGTATTTAASLVFSGEFELVARADPSATSAMVGHGLFCEPTAAGAVTPKQAILASTTFATNAALLLEVSAKWSAADANACRLDIFDVDILGPTVTTL